MVLPVDTPSTQEDQAQGNTVQTVPAGDTPSQHMASYCAPCLDLQRPQKPPHLHHRPLPYSLGLHLWGAMALGWERACACGSYPSAEEGTEEPCTASWGSGAKGLCSQRWVGCSPRVLEDSGSTETTFCAHPPLSPTAQHTPGVHQKPIW